MKEINRDLPFSEGRYILNIYIPISGMYINASVMMYR